MTEGNPLGTAPHPWLVLIAMTGSLSMIMIDQTVVAVTLPRVQRDLDLTQTGLQWTVNAYVLAMASTVALGGRLGDILGRSRMFVAGVFMFALFSAGCGMARDGTMLIVSRALQGIAAGLMQPASAAIVTDTFPLHERGKAMSVYASVAYGTMALGPLIGGFLTEYFSWRWAYWINLPVAAVAIGLALAFCPKQPPEADRSVDSTGAALLLTGTPLLILGIQQGHDWGWSNPIIPGLIATGAILLSLLVFAELRARHPVVDVRLFADRGFLADALVLFFAQFGMIAQVVFLSVYLQNIVGLPPARTGVVLLPLVALNILTSQFAGRMLDRGGIRAPGIIGSVMIMLGFLAHAIFLRYQTLGAVMPGMLCFGIGSGMIMGPANADGLSRVPSVMRGQASGLIQTCRQFGNTLGMAVIGALVLYVEHAGVTRIVRASGGSAADHDRLSGLLSEAVDGQAAALQNIVRAWEPVLADLKTVMTGAIEHGFVLAAGVMALGVLAAVFLMPAGRLTEDEGGGAGRADVDVF